MPLQPAFEPFAASYAAGRPQIVWSELVADLETPVGALLKAAGGEPWHFLLESVEGGASRGRYSIIGMRPDLIWRAEGDKAIVSAVDNNGQETIIAEEAGSLESLRRLLEQSRIDLPDGLPPMAAGLVGYLGYDTVRLMERLPEARSDDIGVPDGLFIRPSLMLVFDSVKDILTVVTPVRPESGVSAHAAYEAAQARVALISERLARAPHTVGQIEVARTEDYSSNTSRQRFHEMVARAKDYIAAGDIFQVVLSQRFSRPFTLPPVSLYRALRRTNPSPFLYYLHMKDFQVVGSSPEILVRVRDGKVTIRPIAGTRPRGANVAEDRAHAQSLLNDPKEVAEHLMLLDLGRNDVGRVAKTGTVKVTERMLIEYYSHVMHIVSNVEGELDPSRELLDALAAGFPAGTVSGAPKIRAMEIIDELEAGKRGIYAGTVGYFGADGSMDTCIVLRTAILKDGVMHVQAGAGVVADSDPESEFMECHHKARALIRAAEAAEHYAGDTSNSAR